MIQYGLIQYATSTSGTWTTLQEPQTTSSEGFLVTHVKVPGGRLPAARVARLLHRQRRSTAAPSRSADWAAASAASPRPLPPPSRRAPRIRLRTSRSATGSVVMS